MTERKLYKVLDYDKPINGGSGTYYLPAKRKDGTWKPGKWMPAVEGELELCENGYHLTDFDHLLDWIGPDIYEAEYKGGSVGDFEDGDFEDGDDKIAVRQVRLVRRLETWNDRAAREFACWCVRNTPISKDRTVWDLLTDDRSRNAVVVAEKFARGEATEAELAAAWDAARDAAWDAARAAARAAQLKHLHEILGE